MKFESIRKLVVLTPSVSQMLEDLKEYYQSGSSSAIIRQLIIEQHEYLRRQNKLYGGVDAVKHRMPKETPSDKEKLAIVVELGGEVVESKEGKVCKYYTYNWKDRYEQQIPLDMVTRTLIEQQYTPSKEIVLQYQNDGLVNY